MEELDQNSRDALRRYRDATGFTAPARARVLERIEASLDEAEARAGAEAEAKAIVTPDPLPSRRRTTTLVVFTALAAALVLALCDLRDRPGDARTTDEKNLAPHTTPSTPTDRTVTRTPTTPTLAPTPPPTAAPRRTTTPDLAAELAHLQQARAALDAHDPALALQHLATHAREFPDGQMREDRQLLRVEALCARGDAPAARAEATAFLRQFPDSPHQARVQSFCPAP